MSKNKKVKEEQPSYTWVSIMQTEAGYVLMQCDSVGDQLDRDSLKLADPEIMAIVLNKAKKILKDNVR